MVIIGWVIVFSLPIVAPLPAPEENPITPTANPEVWVLGVLDVILISLLVSLCIAGITAGLIEAWVEINFKRKRE